MILFDIAEGTTEPQDAQLLLAPPNDPNAMAPWDATGETLAVIIKDKSGNTVSVPVAWLDITSSTVRLMPGASDFSASLSPYTIRYQVTDALGKVTFHPQGIPAQVLVRRK